MLKNPGVDTGNGVFNKGMIKHVFPFAVGSGNTNIRSSHSAGCCGYNHCGLFSVQKSISPSAPKDLSHAHFKAVINAHSS
jgi:hypothetical protein